MFLIIGLGNPGPEYAWTRHNSGFEAIDKLAFDHKIKIGKTKRRAQVGEGVICAEKCVLIKPQTYMNLSGECVREQIAFYKAQPSDIIVIYDDTSLNVGEIRVRKKGSAGGHNGMKNIIRELDTDEFVRVRIGIGEKPPRWDLKDYVLSRFKKEEFDAMVEGVTRACEAVESIIKDGIDTAMNRFNKKKEVPNREEKADIDNEKGAN